MKQFLYRIRPTRLGMLTEGPTEREAAILAEHFQYLQELVSEGIVLMAGRTLIADEQAFGIAVFLAASETEARRIMERDPAVESHIMTAELFPYRIALWSALRPENGEAGG